jgi:hypothetical protein
VELVERAIVQRQHERRHSTSQRITMFGVMEWQWQM